MAPTYRCVMKTTIDMPDDLYRRVKAKSALEGRTVREVTADLYRVWLQGTAEVPAGDGVPQETGRGQRPEWFGSLRHHVTHTGIAHDMESVRRSIAKGLAENRD